MSLFQPLISFDAIEADELNRCLVDWGHKMGPLNRPRFGLIGGAHGLREHRRRMNMDRASASGSTFFSLLATLFIGLKLTGHIDWSWWWVLMPLWAPAILGLVGLAFMWPRIRRARMRFAEMEAEHQRFADEVEANIRAGARGPGKRFKLNED